MADNVPITPGAGATIATDDVGGAHFQRVKLVDGTLDSTAAIPGDATNGLDVDVTRVQGSVTVVQATAANLEANANLRVGGAAVANGNPVPVSDAGGSMTVDSPQLPAALVSGRLDVNLGAAAQLPAALAGGRLDVSLGAAPASVTVVDGGGTISVDDGGGSITVDGAVTASGTVTGNQGTPAAASNAWPVKVSDGTDSVGISTVSTDKALKVDVVQSVPAGQVDKSGFTEGSGRFSPIGGTFNETPASDPTEDQAAAARITAKRALHVNLRNNSGTELGTSGAPVRTDPTGATAQPVSGTVTANLSASTNAGAAAKTADYDTGAGTDTVTMFGLALPKSGGAVPGGTSTDPLRIDPVGTTAQPVNLQLAGTPVAAAASGIPKAGIVDSAGANFSQSNPLPVQTSNMNRTPIRRQVTYSASQTAIAIWTPGASKKFVIESIIIHATGTGDLFIFDNSDSSSTRLFIGAPPAGGIPFQLIFPNGCPSDTANNVLRYSTGAGAAGYITVFGYEV